MAQRAEVLILMDSQYRLMVTEPCIERTECLFRLRLILQFVAVYIVERNHRLAPETVARRKILLRTRNLLEVIFGLMDIGL